jgi:hypothetical protein
LFFLERGGQWSCGGCQTTHYDTLVSGDIYAHESFVFGGELATLRGMLPDCRLFMRRSE